MADSKMFDYRPFLKAYGSKSNPLLKQDKNKKALSGLWETLYRSNASKEAMAKMLKNSDSDPKTLLMQQAKHMADPLNARSGGLTNTAKLLGANALAHPVATGATALNVGGNVAGLLDNDKLGGQLAGTALGIAVPKLLKMNLGPLATVNTAAIAGNLGALFDNLRAKKEQNQAAQQYGG